MIRAQALSGNHAFTPRTPGIQAIASSCASLCELRPAAPEFDTVRVAS